MNDGGDVKHRRHTDRREGEEEYFVSDREAILEDLAEEEELSKELHELEDMAEELEKSRHRRRTGRVQSDQS